MGALDDLNKFLKEGTETEQNTAPETPQEPKAEKPKKSWDKRLMGAAHRGWKGQIEDAKKDGGWSKIAQGNAASGNNEFEQATGRQAMRRQTSAQQRAARQARPAPVQKAFNPALASLLAVAAGIAASDAVVSGAGGRTNKDITADQLRAFSRSSARQTKARQQTKKARTTTAKVKDIRLAYKEMSKADEELQKAHAPVPPIQGLVWDQSAQKWRKPENVGKTASEVQGKKRIRGSGLGQSQRSAGGSGSGKGRGREFAHGRRSRTASGDIGVAGKSQRHTAKKRKRK